MLSLFLEMDPLLLSLRTHAGQWEREGGRRQMIFSSRVRAEMGKICRFQHAGTQHRRARGSRAKTLLERTYVT